ncbi:MAG TPA: flagellar FlbD family protein [Clostridiales bacterium]|nr:flagellar FlbD family protein [Clostridiales bacterium]
MIKLTRINKQEKFWINENLIEFMEETPDTIISLSSGRKVAVAETAEEIIELIEKARGTVMIVQRECGEIIEQ